ncbi:hypothetical protein ACHHV8_23690 [Paenibacillus sp. TAB 01]|uniref:hypothetical protein n=1 Tax=Paenibacillus sp. TAB 01 TaxID=3368988 RepID=UPI003753AF1E
MTWLEWIDELYSNLKINKENKHFMYYPELKLDSVTRDVYIKFLKQNNKTRILFEDKFHRKLYLTDANIIDILSKAPEKVFQIILNWLKQCEKEEFENKIYIEIVNEKFEVPLVFPYLDTKELKENHFISHADFEISYYDLLILISLIVDKERIVQEKESIIRRSRQLKKFIILSSFYRDQSYSGILEKEKYNTSANIYDVYFNKYIAKKIDRIFDAIEY